MNPIAMSDLEIARLAYSKLRNLASRDERSAEAATMQILIEAAAAGRAAGERNGIGMGTRHSRDAVAQILDSFFTR